MITYRSGYKYQLQGDYEISLGLPLVDKVVETSFLRLVDGELTIKEGYAWDGPSGPAIDTKNFMRGSLVHDALYQLMRDRYLDHHSFREFADQTLRRICIEDGMTQLRAWWVYESVRLFADPCADPARRKHLEYAP